MFRPLSLYIGLRYLTARKNNRFIAFINGVSILGIALGVAVLVTVLSIMNGFDTAICDKIFDSAHHLTIQDLRHHKYRSDWGPVRDSLLHQPHIVGVAPFLASQGLLVHTSISQSTLLYGIVPTLEASVSTIPDKLVQGCFDLKPGEKHILVGEQLANQLNASIGSKITLYLPILKASLVHSRLRSQTFEVAGIFRTGNGMGLDNSLAYLHLQDLQQLLQQKEHITGLRVKMDQLYQAPRIAHHLSTSLPEYYRVTDWTLRYGNLTTAIALEKTVTLWILLLMIAIATFNLVSSLIMLVTEKQAEIAILRTLGMSKTTILSIFFVQGTCIGVIGTLLGLIIGYCLSQSISDIAALLEQLLQIKFFQGNIFIQALPSEMQWLDFIRVGLGSIGISMLATLYPAWRATTTTPIDALRYE